MAVFILPEGMIGYYKTHITYITEHAVDPDKRRYADTAEAPRHFIDADEYGAAPFDSIPEKYSDAVAKFSESGLRDRGIVPWHIERSYFALVKAFRENNSTRILKYSADLGHYVADAHVPLHTTKNYNGQLTRQVGIHGFWESRLPELFSGSYNLYTGPAKYISNPLKEAWRIIRNTYLLKDSVLLIEARLSKRYPSNQKYTFSKRNGKVEKQYSETYSAAYHHALKGMVEKQMRASILAVGSYWYSAWVDAGQPDLGNLQPPKINSDTRREKAVKPGKIIDREE